MAITSTKKTTTKKQTAEKTDSGAEIKLLEAKIAALEKSLSDAVLKIEQAEFTEDKISEIENLFVSGAQDIRQGSAIGSQTLAKIAGSFPKTAQFRQLNKTADALISAYQAAETSALRFADLSDLIAGIIVQGYSETTNPSHQEIFNQFLTNLLLISILVKLKFLYD